MLHHIQKSIFDRLATAESLRYGEIKPAKLDGNVFGYHLKSLVSARLIEKRDDGSYTLTAHGRDYIVHRYETAGTAAHTIFLIVVRAGNRWLLRRRTVQPLIGRVGFVHGEPTAGVTVVEAAEARLRAKTGLAATLTVRLHALISQYVGDELMSYSHAIILTGETSEDEIIAADATGENFWLDTLELPQILPSCHDIVTAIESGTTWIELSYHSIN